MTHRKTITVLKSHAQYVGSLDRGMSGIAREAIIECMEGERKAIPTRGTRYKGNSPTKRTTVSLEKRQVEFVNENEINLSALIRETIGEWIDLERRLQEIEDDPGDLLSDPQKAMIDILLKSRRSQRTDKRFPLRWIRRYHSGSIHTTD